MSINYDGNTCTFNFLDPLMAYSNCTNQWKDLFAQHLKCCWLLWNLRQSLLLSIVHP